MVIGAGGAMLNKIFHLQHLFMVFHLLKIHPKDSFFHWSKLHTPYLLLQSFSVKRWNKALILGFSFLDVGFLDPEKFSEGDQLLIFFRGQFSLKFWKLTGYFQRCILVHDTEIHLSLKSIFQKH